MFKETRVESVNGLKAAVIHRLQASFIIAKDQSILENSNFGTTAVVCSEYLGYYLRRFVTLRILASSPIILGVKTAASIVLIELLLQIKKK
ncbi:unnamed protein product [Heterobilharzia americana]|nr:unnamed protein product [Heterobilharzia americana]